MDNVTLLQTILEELLEDETDPVDIAYMLRQLAEELESGGSMDPDELRQVIVGLSEEI